MSDLYHRIASFAQEESEDDVIGFLSHYDLSLLTNVKSESQMTLLHLMCSLGKVLSLCVRERMRE